jgi:hypothetical protein
MAGQSGVQTKPISPAGRAAGRDEQSQFAGLSRAAPDRGGVTLELCRAGGYDGLKCSGPLLWRLHHASGKPDVG